jgi:hypothetical protein
MHSSQTSGVARQRDACRACYLRRARPLSLHTMFLSPSSIRTLICLSAVTQQWSCACSSSHDLTSSNKYTHTRTSASAWAGQACSSPRAPVYMATRSTSRKASPSCGRASSCAYHLCTLLRVWLLASVRLNLTPSCAHQVHPPNCAPSAVCVLH